MPKSAVINLDYGLTGNVSFKKLSLLFEDIYVNTFSLYRETRVLPFLKDKSTTSEYVQEVEFLENKVVIKTYSLPSSEFSIQEHDSILAEDMRRMGKVIEENLIYNDSEDILNDKTDSKLKLVGVLRTNNEMTFNMRDIGMRIDALRLSLENTATEFVPLVKGFGSYKVERSNTSALHFVLDKIPTPGENTSWEQVIDFRSDEHVKRKYYALINWVNEMSKSDMPLSHIADKYNQLYSEYIRQFSLHKMNSSFTTIELLALGGMDFFNHLTSQNFVSAFRSLLDIRRQQISLLKSEREIEGRELAYIHSVNERFP